VFLKAQIDQKKVSSSLLEKFKLAEGLYNSFPDKLQGNLEKSYPSKYLCSSFMFTSHFLPRADKLVLNSI